MFVRVALRQISSASQHRVATCAVPMRSKLRAASTNTTTLNMSGLASASEQFEKYGACDAADALVAAGIDDGGTLAYLRQQSGPKTTRAGPAYTVEYAPKDDPRPAVAAHYIDSIPAGSVVLIVTSPAAQLPYAPYTLLRCSLYGGLMSNRAHYQAARATVVLGQVRDIDEHRELDYPVHSYGVGVCAPNKLAKVVAVNQPVTLKGGSDGAADRTIAPGDIVVADENGVVVVPQDHVASALEYIPRRVEADKLAQQDIRAGVPAAKAQKERRKGL